MVNTNTKSWQTIEIVYMVILATKCPRSLLQNRKKKQVDFQKEEQFSGYQIKEQQDNLIWTLPSFISGTTDKFVL